MRHMVPQLLSCTLLLGPACAEPKARGPIPPIAPDTTKVAEIDGALGPADDDEDTGFGSSPQEDEAAAQAEKQRQRMAQAIAATEAKYAKEGERWTPELKAETKKLATTKFRNTKVAMKAILASGHREPGNAERDKHRHPAKTLAFLGIKPNMTVFEVGPGGGWYTELLAPLLHRNGQLVLAGYDSKSDDPITAYFGRSLELMLGKSGELYGKVQTVLNKDPKHYELGAPQSLDAVLLVRQTHNLIRGGNLDQFLAQAHGALKAGGILAVVQHRADDKADPVASAQKGYVPQSWLIEKISKAGFELAAQSEINANPKDTKDHPKGVWTLPPVLALGDQDQAKYREIGESDRMTLRFVRR